MTYLPKHVKQYSVPSLYLNHNSKLMQVEEYKYLGVYISSNGSVARDLHRQIGYIYSKGNMLVRKFEDPLLQHVFCTFMV